MAEFYPIQTIDPCGLDEVLGEIDQIKSICSEEEPSQEQIESIAVAIALMNAVRTKCTESGALNPRGVKRIKRFETMPIPLEDLNDVNPGETYNCASVILQVERHFRLSRMALIMGSKSSGKQKPESVQAYWQMRLGTLGLSEYAHDRQNSSSQDMVEASYAIPSTVIPLAGKVPLLGAADPSESVHSFAIYAHIAVEALRLSGTEVSISPYHG